MSVEQFEALRELVQMHDRSFAEHGAKFSRHFRVLMDAVLDDVSRELGHDLTGLWRVRVGVEEAGAFCNAVAWAVVGRTVSEGGAA